MNKKTIAITAEQYKTIIATMKQGFSGCRPNERIATALILEANLGLRISDIVKLRLADIVHDGDRYRLSIVEQKTKKARTFTVPLALYQFIRCYCLDHNIAPEARIFPITERAVQKRLQSVFGTFLGCALFACHDLTVSVQVLYLRPRTFGCSSKIFLLFLVASWQPPCLFY